MRENRTAVCALPKKEKKKIKQTNDVSLSIAVNRLERKFESRLPKKGPLADL